MSKDITVKGKSKVIAQNAISFSCCGEEIASISAEYDFSSLPSGLHSMAIQLIQQKSVNLCLPYDFLPPENKIRQRVEQQIRARESEKKRDRISRPWWKFWG